MNKFRSARWSDLILAGLVSACAQSTKIPCIDPARIDPEKICTMQYDPVCGCDGKTYSNACVADGKGLLRWEAGECGND